VIVYICYMKKVQNYLEYFLVRSISFVIRSLPLNVGLWLGRLLGSLIFYVIPIRKSVAIENLTRAFPEKSPQEIKGIAYRTYLNFGQNIIEFMRFPSTTAERLAELVTFANPELFSVGAGRGTVCISGHFGNWEIMGAAICALGHPMAAIARKQRNRLVDKIINQNRASVGIETIQLGMAIRGVIRALRQNKFVAMLGDQDAHDEGVFIDFLGRPSSTAPGPAIFALKTGAPMLFGAAVREKGGKHTVYLKKIDTEGLDRPTKENIRILTQRHSNALEESIRRWPDHWFWMHKRWKTRPKEEALHHR
jgi:KDO2-lipid IV(A) lauroyltransferase